MTPLIQPPIDPRYIAVADAARRLSVAPLTLRRAIRRGEIPSCRIGRRVLVSVAGLDGLVNVPVQS